MGWRVPCLLGCVFFLASAAFGQGRAPERGSEHRGGRPMMGPVPYSLEQAAKDLHLTADQVAGLKDLRQGFLRDTLPWRNELVIKRMELQDLLGNLQAEPDRVVGKQREVSDLESRIRERVVSYRLELRKVLTPEQILLLPPALDSPGYGRHRMMRGPGPYRGRD